MAINFQKSVQKAKISSDQILFNPEDAVDGIILVHQGEIAIQIQKKNEQTGVSDFVTIWSLQDGMICGDMIVATSGRSLFRAISQRETIVSVYPLPARSFSSAIGTKLNLGIMMARSLIRQLLLASKQEKEAASFFAEIQKFFDNSGLVLFKFDGMRFQANASGSTKPVYQELSNIVNGNVSLLFDKGSGLPESIDTSFFDNDFSKVFYKSYKIKPATNDDQIHFYKRFFSMPSAYQQQFFEGQANLIRFVIQDMANLLQQKIESIQTLLLQCDQVLDQISGQDKSIFLEFIPVMEKNQLEKDPLRKQEVAAVVQHFLNKITDFSIQYRQIWNISFRGVDSRVKTYLDQFSFQESIKEQAAPSQSHPAVVSSSSQQIIDGELKDSMQQIIAFSGIDSDKALKFFQLWGQFKDVKNKLDSDSDMRKMRRTLSKVYWEIYKKSFLKFVKTQLCPKPVDMMFQFGFLDEKVLSPDQVMTLYRYQDNSPGQYPVYSPKEWLQRIYTEQDNPSITELGQFYKEILRQELRVTDTAALSKMDRLPNDKSDTRLEFEIDHMVSNGTVMVAGSIGSAFPILISDLLPSDMRDLFSTRKAIEDAVNEWREIDFSLFYREVLYKEHDTAKIINEFVRMEVLPIFILLPSVGMKSAMWQEMDGKDKNSPARFLIPNMATGHIREMLVDSFGVFRWEIVRNIAGAGWADASAAILTSDYFDYQEFFKKNSNLSQETKEKLKVEFKKYRDPRSRFVNDYKNWMFFEKEGVPKLNRVARDIFIRHVPFRKERRQSLATFPAFANPLTRYENVQMRKKKEMENRYHKYERSDKTLPPALQQNLDFFNI